MYKSISSRKQERRNHARTMQSFKTSDLRINIEMSSYVMNCTHAKRTHKLQPRWQVPMRVTDVKSHLVIVVENINYGSMLVALARRMSPDPTTRRGEKASIELKQQSSKHYGTQYHLVESIRGIREIFEK